MRVLHVFGVLNIGGAETMIMNLYRKIDRNKIQFDFVVHGSEKGFFEEEISELGGKIYRCPKYSASAFFEYKKWWKDFFQTHKEYQILHSHVRSTASIYMPLARKNGMKTIIHSHSTSNGNGFSAAIKAVLQYPLRFQADYYMACSKAAGEWLFGKKKCTKKEFSVVKNAIDAEKFIYSESMRTSIRNSLKLRNEFTLGYLARVTTPKNPLFVIDIFCKIKKELPQSKLLFVGDGELLESVKNKVKEVGLDKDVIFTGAKSEACYYYSAMDCYILPSIWEGLGISLIEAQASGLRCVCSDIIPNEAIITDLVQALSLSDRTKWVETIIEIADGYIRKNYSQEIKNAGYDISTNVEYISDYYMNIVQRGK